MSLMDSTKIHTINFDDMAHPRGGPQGRDDTIDNIIRHIKDLDSDLDIIIDGWFSFQADWWKSGEHDQSLQILRSKLGSDFEIIPIILFRNQDAIMKEIESNDSKFRYPEYRDQIIGVYKFICDHIWRWFDGQGKETPS
jgi:hypothetical protein